MTPLVSVVMPVRNAALYLDEAVNSVLSQSLENFELIIVDDGSTDETGERLAAYSEPRIRLLKTLGGNGISRALNIGIAVARGRYIARMEGDDICHPERLQWQSDCLEQHPEVAMLGSSILCFGNTTSERLLVPPSDSVEIMI